MSFLMRSSLRLGITIGLLILACLPFTSPAHANTCSWTNAESAGPSNRYGHAMVYDALRDEVVLFGGSFSFDPLHDDTWVWRGDSGWREVNQTGDRPSGRRRHSMAYDSRRGVTVLFGGLVQNFGNDSASGETWEWDGCTWTHKVIRGPSARMNAAMAFDSARGVIVLFGGMTETASGFPSEVFGDTWEYDGTEWRQVSLNGQGPAARRMTTNSMVFDAARGVCVLFGGQTIANDFYSDTWTWNGTSWTLVPTSNAPSPRNDGVMIYDTASERVMLFGGDGVEPGLLGDTWSWDGAEWELLTLNGPAPRSGHSMAFDSRAETCIVFGGNSAPFAPLGDTWTFSTRPCGDFDHSGSTDIIDLLEFLDCWFEGDGGCH